MAKHIHIHYVKDSKPSIHGLFTKSALEKGASGSGIFLFKYAKLSMSWPYFSKATAQSNLKKRLAEVPSDNPEIYEYSKQECEAELKKSFKDSIPATQFFEGTYEEFRKKVKAAHPTVTFGSPGPRGFSAMVGGEEVGTIGSREIKPGIFRGGYRTELRDG